MPVRPSPKCIRELLHLRLCAGRFHSLSGMKEEDVGPETTWKFNPKRMRSFGSWGKDLGGSGC